MSRFRAAQRVRMAVTQLLGARAVPSELGGRAHLACSVCGAPVELSPSLARKAREHTCSRDCRAELARRRLETRGLQDPATRERARVSIIMRKGRPNADALLALEPEVFDALPELQCNLVRAY